jgi:hypothetical protein
MDILITLSALCLLMLVAYRGFSVILFAPVAALLAVLLTDPVLVPPFFSGMLHGEAGRLPKALLPGVPTGRGAGQADRAVWLCPRHHPARDCTRLGRTTRCWRWCWSARF